MPKPSFPSTALPPPEVVEIIKKNHLSPEHIEGWYAAPSQNPPKIRLSQEQIKTYGQADAVQVMDIFREQKVLSETIHKIDLGTGCGRGCHTCLADAPWLSNLFSLESLKKLFREKWFLTMLNAESLRIGNAADPSDHPDLVEIVTFILYQTRFLDKNLRLKSKEQKRHKIHIFTNYRPDKKSESQLTELLNLAVKYQGRMSVTISLPLNANDTVNDKFIDYVKSKREFFLMATKYLDVRSRYESISIQDVRHDCGIFTTGRRLSIEILSQKIDHKRLIETDRKLDYQHSGSTELLLNPSALWFAVHTTIYSSHTVISYTPASLKNLSVLSQLPWVNYENMPPNWPGGISKTISTTEAKQRMLQAKLSGNRRRSVNIVH